MVVCENRHVAHTIEPHLWVSDLSASKSWYESLGFTERQRNPADDPTWFQLALGDVRLMITIVPIQIADNQQYLQGVANRVGHGGAVSLYLHVDSADEMYERATSAGIEPIETIWDPWWGGRQFTIADPDGNWWTIYQNI
jgi:uncharacterized glyoxalase superfamily protein PhnB